MGHSREASICVNISLWLWAEVCDEEDVPAHIEALHVGCGVLLALCLQSIQVFPCVQMGIC